MSKAEMVAAWRKRALENLEVAGRLLAIARPAVYAAVSRMYYSLFQAVCARLLEKGLAVPGQNHGEVWQAADTLQPGLFFDLQDLHSWRRKADYATGEIPLAIARDLVANYTTRTRELTAS
ncbi:MAG: hypothetical protein FJ265_12960 [Planctomycetes bacterium]|nr:hypothetical protein [Planctomycetota bacterium]